MRKIFTLAAVLLASASVFAFQANMTSVEVNAEIAQRLRDGESIEKIAEAANKVGVAADVITVALVKAGKSPEAVVVALKNAGFSGYEVVKAAAGNNADLTLKLNNAVIAASGGDISSVLPPTAAGLTTTNIENSAIPTAAGAVGSVSPS